MNCSAALFGERGLSPTELRRDVFALRSQSTCLAIKAP